MVKLLSMGSCIINIQVACKIVGLNPNFPERSLSREAIGGAGSQEWPGVLLPGGHFVVKLLQGTGSQEFALQLQRHFTEVSWVQPKATRHESREMYLVGLNRRL